MTFALCSCVLHEVDDKAAFLAEARRVLAPGGRIAVVEWRTDYPDRGPSAALRLGPDETAALLAAAGFVPEPVVAISDAYYGLAGVLTGTATAPTGE